MICKNSTAANIAPNHRQWQHSTLPPPVVVLPAGPAVALVRKKLVLVAPLVLVSISDLVICILVVVFVVDMVVVVAVVVVAVVAVIFFSVVVSFFGPLLCKEMQGNFEVSVTISHL